MNPQKIKPPRSKSSERACRSAFTSSNKYFVKKPKLTIEEMLFKAFGPPNYPVR